MIKLLDYVLDRITMYRLVLYVLIGLIGGYLVVRKLREERIVSIFTVTSLVTICIVSLVQGLSITKELQQLLLESPLFFFATIMFTSR